MSDAANAVDESPEPAPEVVVRLPPIVEVLARILVRLALEGEGVVPANDNT